MKVNSIAECFPWSIPQCFWPALSDNWSWKPILAFFLSGRLRQVILHKRCKVLPFEVDFCSSKLLRADPRCLKLPFTIWWLIFLHNWASAWDFQQCGMCDQQSLRSACAYAQSDQSFCLSLEYSLSVKLLTEHHLEFLSLKGGCTGSSESTLVKMSNCWKSHAMVHEPVHEIFNNVVCATSKASDQPAHTHSLIRAFASRLNTSIIWLLSYWLNIIFLVSKLKRMLHTLVWVYTCQNTTLLEISCHGSYIVTGL